jgi:hypothetical protein
MPGPVPTVKPPPYMESDGEEERTEHTGEIDHGEMGTWVGNALVLLSVGTIALVVAPKSKQLVAFANLLVVLSIGLLLWASYKFFILKLNRHHWSEWVLAVLICGFLAAAIWFITIVNRNP